jgi:hypothetical protein
MVQLEMNDEEARVLRSVVDNYTAHLEVEIHRTERRDFREALERREKVLHDLIRRLSKSV